MKPIDQALLVRPHSHTGLTKHDLKKIERWLDGREESSAAP